MKRWVAICVFAVAVTPVWPASDISFFGGWIYSGSARQGLEEVDLRNFSTLGLRHERYFAIFGLENSLSYLSAPMVISGQEGDGGLSYSGNLVINLPMRGMVPYLTFGLGLLHKLGDTEPDVGTRFHTNFGLGVKFRRRAGPLGVRLDYRRYNIRRVLDDSLRTNELSAGIMLSF